jgi:hypothetical protein
MAKIIWIKGMLGPTPQYIQDEAAVLTGTGMRKTQEIIEEIDIPENEQHLGLSILSRMYPCRNA